MTAITVAKTLTAADVLGMLDSEATVASMLEGAKLSAWDVCKGFITSRTDRVDAESIADSFQTLRAERLAQLGGTDPKIGGKKDATLNRVDSYKSRFLSYFKDWGTLDEVSKEDKKAAAELEKAQKTAKMQDEKTAQEQKMRDEIRKEMLGGSFKLVTLLDCIGMVASAAKAGILARDERAAMLALADTIAHYVGAPAHQAPPMADVVEMVQQLTH